MKKKLLIVEDNPVNMKLLKLLIKNMDFEPLYAENGKEALRIIKEHVPDIVLCDIQMPEMDGIQLVQHIRAENSLSHITVIAVTAHAMVGDRERLLSYGFDAYISKPIDTRKLRELLLAYLEGNSA